MASSADRALSAARVRQVTVERRLYDIGSILSSANLIKKSYLGRKRCVLCMHAPAPAVRLSRLRAKEFGIHSGAFWKLCCQRDLYMKRINSSQYTAGSRRSPGCGMARR